MQFSRAHQPTAAAEGRAGATVHDADRSARPLRAAVAFAGLLAMTLAGAQGLRPPMPTEALSAESSVKAPQIDLRATQINRCSDGRSGIVLQDSPCSPPAASAAAEAIEMSALTPRPPPDPARTASTEAPASVPKWLVTLGWKLCVIALVVFVLWRAVGALRERKRYRETAADSPDRTPLRVR